MTDVVTSPRGHDHTELAQVLRSFAEERVVFVANPGNAGDALINLGMYALFRRLGVTWEAGTISGSCPDRVVIFSGGGVLIDLYPNADVFFRRNHPVCKALILLPIGCEAMPICCQRWTRAATSSRVTTTVPHFFAPMQPGPMFTMAMTWPFSCPTVRSYPCLGIAAFSLARKSGEAGRR